jgi:hypothetical protein
MNTSAAQRSRHPDLCFCPDCITRRPARRAAKQKTLGRVRAMVEGAEGKRADCLRCGAGGKALASGFCSKCEGR